MIHKDCWYYQVRIENVSCNSDVYYSAGAAFFTCCLADESSVTALEIAYNITRILDVAIG
eukprot:snap_masked-scaffold_12-processed-gene-0.45-mRNA-1 protein AED:1.00 eAED:1.00 QI:0/0/0/0/1/1/2/0/59